MKFDPTLPDADVNVSDTHPVREALVLVGGIAAMAAVLFVAIALAVELVVPRLPPGLEARLFSNAWLAESLGPQGGGAPDPRAPRVGQLLARLGRHWRDNPYELRVGIWNESTPNALAFPGGFIVVTSGLLEQVASENELAFVLAHEIGHFRNRDQLRGLGRGVAFALVVGALGFGGSGGVSRIVSASGGLAARGFDRRQERRADRFGLELVQAEYGHVAGAWDFFERLPDPAGAVGKAVLPYLATHPLNDDRIAALRELAVERGWPLDGPLTPLAAD